MDSSKKSNHSRRSRTTIDNPEQDEFERLMKEQILKMFEDFDKETPKKPLEKNEEMS